jgi:hypothetical protein
MAVQPVDWPSLRAKGYRVEKCHSTGTWRLKWFAWAPGRQIGQFDDKGKAMRACRIFEDTPTPTATPADAVEGEGS